MKKLTAILIAAFISLAAISQPTPEQIKENQRIAAAKKDSLDKAYNDSIVHLVSTKMLITKAIIDSAFVRTEKTLTKWNYDQHIGEYEFFRDMLIVTWLELYRREEQKKSKTSK